MVPGGATNETEPPSGAECSTPPPHLAESISEPPALLIVHSQRWPGFLQRPQTTATSTTRAARVYSTPAAIQRGPLKRFILATRARAGSNIHAKTRDHSTITKILSRMNLVPAQYHHSYSNLHHLWVKHIRPVTRTLMPLPHKALRPTGGPTCVRLVTISNILLRATNRRIASSCDPALHRIVGAINRVPKQTLTSHLQIMASRCSRQALRNLHRIQTTFNLHPQLSPCSSRQQQPPLARPS